MKKIIMLSFALIFSSLTLSSKASSQEVDLQGLENIEDELLSIERSQMMNVEAITKLTDEAAANDDDLGEVLANEYVTDEVKSGLSGLLKINEKTLSDETVKNSIPESKQVKSRRVRSR